LAPIHQGIQDFQDISSIKFFTEGSAIEPIRKIKFTSHRPNLRLHNFCQHAVEVQENLQTKVPG